MMISVLENPIVIFSVTGGQMKEQPYSLNTSCHFVQ